MKKIIIAPDSFKESMVSWEIADVIEKAIIDSFPEFKIYKMPLSDGGEGLIEILARRLNAQIHSKIVTGPLHNQISANFAISEELSLGIMDVASVIGFKHIPKEKRNPYLTNTYGVGELLLHIASFGVKRIIIGLGGSSTVDGGAGMAQALGFEFLHNNKKIGRITGNNLKDIDRIDSFKIKRDLESVQIQAACDVKNILLGADGAARIYGPQKGATPEQVEQLEIGLQNLAQCIKQDLEIQVSSVSGAGAAGGLGAGLLGFLNAEILTGIELVMELIGFYDLISDADIVITGEGRFDKQSFNGKAVGHVIETAKQSNVPVGIIAGNVSAEIRLDKIQGLLSIETLISKAASEKDAIENAPKYLYNAAQNLINKFIIQST